MKEKIEGLLLNFYKFGFLSEMGRKTEEDIREEESAFPDFYVVCDGCLNVEHCVELPHMAHGKRVSIA